MKKYFLCAALAAAAMTAQATDRLKYVDPNIGTGGHGHVFLGANVPSGMVQLGPSQIVKGWDWCSGYHDSDSTLVGFSHVHLSGTGIGDLGDVLFMPSTDRNFNQTTFAKSTTEAKPGSYFTVLPEKKMIVGLTATERTGMHMYKPMNSHDSVFVKVNLRYGIGWDNRKFSSVKQTGPASLSGYRLSRGWAPDHRMYFVAQFSRSIANISYKGDSIAICAFAPSAQPLLAKVGVSAVSEAGAAANLVAENPGWDFMAVKTAAENKWRKTLGRIDARSSDPVTLRKFYTALYHALFAPVLFSDVNGDYRGADGKIYNDPANANYSIFSLWDTYRAAHPLYTLIMPERQADFANTFINIYRQQGKLPVWHLHGNETNCMVGNPGVIVLADLLSKGFVADTAAAYEAMRNTMMLDERSMDDLRKYGYIPYNGTDTTESVAKGMEYAIAYDALAKTAEKLGKADDAEYFGRLGRSYREYFDPKLGFMRGKSTDGKFRQEEYNPFKTTHRADDYCEGNGWQYIWLAPQDPHGLIDLFGSEGKFTSKLDQLFKAEGDLGEDASPDISGLIGQYAHGNEPSHHVLYLYNYAGQPAKAAPLLRYVMSDLYRDQPDGLCGNEDVGQMSSWYILSAMGLYQVEPVGGKFVIGTPVLDSATLQLGNGKTFTINAVNNSDKNIYVQSATLDGKPLKRSYITFDEIRRGGELRLVMGPKPSKFGTAKNARP